MSNIKRKVIKRPTTSYDIENYILTLIRTHQLWQQRFKENYDEYVYISSEYFDPFKYQLKELESKNKLSIIKKAAPNGYEYNCYKVFIPGEVNFNLIKPKNEALSNLHIVMLKHLLTISLPSNSPTTNYFDAFLFYRNSNPRIFFTVDSFAKRVHTPVTSFPKGLRQNILIKGEVTTSLDICTMQPLILGKILEAEIGENDFSNWINSGQDIYLILKEKTKLETREIAKEKFYEISYGKSIDNLITIFGESNWINWIHELKNKPLISNPHTLQKGHSNLAWLMQTTEVEILTKVWKLLVEFNIPFLTVHDEIIVRKSDFSKTKDILSRVLSNEFTYFKINCDYNPPPQPDG